MSEYCTPRSETLMVTGHHGSGGSRAGPTATRARTSQAMPCSRPRAHGPVSQQAGCVPVGRDFMLPCNCQQHELSLSKAA